MIYVGTINFSKNTDTDKKLEETLRLFTEGTPKTSVKGELTLCYGKLSKNLDLDDVWENEHSLLMGCAFDRETHRVLEKEKFGHLTYLNHQSFLENIWGKYLCLSSQKGGKEFEITLDSRGQLPCFYHVLENGNVVIASHIELIYKILKNKPQYNWNYISSYLKYGAQGKSETPFQDIYELPPACTLKISKTEKTITPSWNPLKYYKNSEIQNKDIADILQETLQAWTDPYEKIYVSLSGGLDSSSVVYSLKNVIKKDQELKAFNYFHSQVQSSNELVHARKVCEDTGIQLSEIDVSDCLPFAPPQWKQPLKPNKPCPGMVCSQWLDRVRDQLDFGAPITVIDGQGSDHIFMRPPTKKAMLDYMIERGLKGSAEQLAGISQFYRDPLYSTLKENALSACSHILGKKKQSIKEDVSDIPNWIDPKFIKKAENGLSHPIYESLPQNVLPGKFEQINALYEGLSSIHLEVINACSPMFSPFLCQPVVEYALSLPTYELFDKGYDRYPLRKSISDRFGADVAWRRDKSQTTGLFQLGLKQNMTSVLELCLEGHLAKKGILNPEGFRKTVDLIAHGDHVAIWFINYVTSIETFLRYWDEV